MNTLDALVQEVILRMEAAGGRVWISPESTDYLKVAFLEALLNYSDRKPNGNTTGHTIGIDNGKKSW